MPTRDNEENDDNRAAGSDADEEIPALEWKPADMRALLQQSRAMGTCNESLKKRVRLRKKSTHYQVSTIVKSMWGKADTCPTSSNSYNQRRLSKHFGNHRRVRGIRPWSGGEGIFQIGRPLLEAGFQRRKLSFVQCLGGLLQDGDRKSDAQHVRLRTTICMYHSICG